MQSENTSPIPPSAAKPPDSLTGAQNTSAKPQNASEVAVDWLSWTFHARDEINTTALMERVLEKLAFFVDDVEPLPRGMHGYASAANLNGGPAKLAWSPERAEQGVHLSIPGSALSSFLGPSDTLPAFVGYLAQHVGGKARRVDIAFDDFTGKITIDKLLRYIRRGSYVCKWKSRESTERYGVVEGDPTGLIIRFGKRQSETFARLYDKRLERLDKTGECEHEYWTRIELEFKGRRAAELGERIADDPPDLVKYLCGLLRESLDFKRQIPTETNKARWPTAAWWSEFLHEAEKRRLTIPKPSRSVATAELWIRHQVGPSLAMAVKADGDRWLTDAVADGLARLRPEHQRMIDAHRKERSTSTWKETEEKLAETKMFT